MTLAVVVVLSWLANGCAETPTNHAAFQLGSSTDTINAWTAETAGSMTDTYKAELLVDSNPLDSTGLSDSALIAEQLAFYAQLSRQVDSLTEFQDSAIAELIPLLGQNWDSLGPLDQQRILLFRKRMVMEKMLDDIKSRDSAIYEIIRSATPETE